MIFDHIITKLPNHELILEAKATAVCLKRLLSYRIPRELLSKMQLFLPVDSRGSNEDVNNRNNSCNYSGGKDKGCFRLVQKALLALEE
ncbi:Acyl-acyl carrier protein thioesterase ATL3 chloroplastic [Zea mays]|nr:Acyl-acyl carrier protein thioesterase ATL3 chloroplastic [Zea mays]